MKKISLRGKLVSLSAVVSAIMIGVTPMTAFAQVPVCTCETKCTEEVCDPDCPICKEDITMCEGIEPETEPEAEENFGPLTPDGNMSLVDDYGSIEAGGKQFITVVTKTGNYFYIIIDRDDEGDDTVHFLNMVDESDLLKLMDDEEAQAYVESIAGTTEESTTVEAEEPTTETEEPAEEPVQEEKKKSSAGILILMFVVGAGGIGAYVFMKGSKKKDTRKAGPDPDADYDEDEDDFLAGLEDDEEIMEEELDEMTIDEEEEVPDIEE